MVIYVPDDQTSIFELSDQLWPIIQKQKTRYRLAIPVVVRVACTLLKLARGAIMRLCFELFAIGTSTVSSVIHDTCCAINIGYVIKLLGRPVPVFFKFKIILCGLPAVVGAIDGMHVSIFKLRVGPEDCFSFKTHGYTFNCQAIVDSMKIFLDLFLGTSGSTNDARMLQRSSLYQLAVRVGIIFPIPR